MRFLAAAAGCACWPTGACGQAAAPVPFVLTRRTLDVRVDYTTGAVAGNETLTLRNITDHVVVEAPLLLNRLMRFARVSDTAGDPVQFRQAVVLFEDDSVLQVNSAVVSLQRPVAPGDSVTIVAQYGGHLVGYVETGSRYIQDRVDSAFTILREDAFAFPALGVPSRRRNRAAGGGFDHPFAFTARVTVPAGQVVATGGAALEPTPHDSLVTWTFQSVAPAPFLNIAIAPYRTLTRPGLRIFYFPEDSSGAQMVDHAVSAAMTQYATWYGALGDSAPLTIIEIPTGWGSQASLAGGIIETADAFRDRAQLYQLYHELSHLWNVADRDQPSPRWNEGLASLLQWRMASAIDGWEAWDAQMDRVERSLRNRCQAPTPCGTVPFSDYGKADLTGLSYPVGMAMFYALFKTIGAAAFDRAYRDFRQRHRVTGATGADLRAAFHAVSPATDPIFDQWFSGVGWYNRLAAGETLRHIVEGYPHASR